MADGGNRVVEIGIGEPIILAKKSDRPRMSTTEAKTERRGDYCSRCGYFREYPTGKPYFLEYECPCCGYYLVSDCIHYGEPDPDFGVALG